MDVLLIFCIIPLIFGSSYLLVDLGIAFGGAVAITLVWGITYVMIKKADHKKDVNEYKAKLATDAARVNRERKEIAILRAHQSTIHYSNRNRQEYKVS